MKELKEFGPWSEQLSSTGRKYFYNKETEVSQWEKPKEWREFELEQERLNNDMKMPVMQPPPPPPMFMPPFFHPPPGFPAFATPPPFHPPPFAGTPGQYPAMPIMPSVVPPPPRVTNTQVAAPPSVPSYNALQTNKTYKPSVNITHTVDLRLDIKKSPATPGTPTATGPPSAIPSPFTHNTPQTLIEDIKEEIEETPKALKREHESSPDEKVPPKKMKEEVHEPWMRFYCAEAAQAKRAQLRLDADSEIASVVAERIALENKLILELTKVKQAAAMVAVQEHEVLMCNSKITNLQEQQTLIELRAQKASPVSLPDLKDLKMQFSQ
ncbi:unnamed protein product [Auanema sp. JU1783]|nr:unnamed protein product [Auanema sp. JU1783]